MSDDAAMSQLERKEVRIFNAALELPAAIERAAFLDQACAGDPALRRQVEALLQAHAGAEDYFQTAVEPQHRPAQPATAIVPITEKPGDRIGRYKLLQKIGEGGCGVVYMAEQEEPVRRRVALKVIKFGMDTKSVVARFEAERQALAMMDHENIARVLDAGATGTGRPYFVMELVKGVRITEYCDQNHLSTQARLDLFMKVCLAIQHAHQKGIIHRDIKPSNILVTLHDGMPVPKVIDFGIAKATEARLTDKTLFTAFEQFIGTPAYMSPEQAEMSGLDIDTRSDIYSLGVLLYELLTGKTPFDARELWDAGLEAMRRTIREKEPVRPSTRLQTMLEGDLTTTAKHRHAEPLKLINLLRGDIDWIVMKALEKDRTRRYETASGLAADVQRHLSNEPVLAGPPSNLYRFQKMVRRNKLAFAAGTAIVTLLVLGAAVSSWQAVRAIRAEREQNRLRADAEIARQNEARLRHQSEAAEKSAVIQAGRAEAAATETKLTLSSSDFLQAARLISENNGGDALAYLARSLSLNPTNDAALTRLATLLTFHSWMTTTLFVKHSGIVFSAQFSPDGRQIVTASADRTARVWDAQSGQPLTEPLKHSSGVRSVQFSPDGKRILTASDDHTARVWDAQSGLPLMEPLRHGSNVVSAQFSSDGKRIVTRSLDQLERVWDAYSGQSLAVPLRFHDSVPSGKSSPDGKRIITVSGNAARVLDAQSGQPVTEPLQHNGAVRSAQFSPDGKRIVTAAEDYTARVWDAQNGMPLLDPLKHNDRVWDAQFSPDGKRIVTASWDKLARVWDIQNGLPLAEPLKHTGQVHTPQFSQDGKRILTASDDHTARVWDAQSGLPLIEPLRHGSNVVSAQFSSDGKRIVTRSLDQLERVWDAYSGQSLAVPLRFHDSVPSGKSSPDGKRIITVSGNAARVFDAQSGQPVTEPLQHKGAVRSAQFSPDGKRIVTAADTVRVWDALTGQPLTEPLVHDLALFVLSSAQFSPDGKRILTASSSTARVWDALSGQPLTEPLSHPPLLNSAQFSPDGKRILTASANGTLRVWDAQSGQPLTELLKYGGRFCSARFSPDGKRIATGSADGTARVWDFVPAEGRFPDWLLQLSEAVCGKVVNHQGVLVATRLSRAETIRQIREKLSRAPADDDWVIWGRWYLADPNTRTISPFSTITVPEYIERRIKENTAASLAEAEELALGHPDLLRRVFEARGQLENRK